MSPGESQHKVIGPEPSTKIRAILFWSVRWNAREEENLEVAEKTNTDLIELVAIAGV